MFVNTMQNLEAMRPPSSSSNHSAEKNCLFSLDFDPYPTNSSSPYTPSVSTIWVVICTINGLTSPVIVAINLLVIWAVLEKEQLRNTSYNILIAILALSDLLVGLAIQPVFISLIVCLLLGCPSICELTIAYYMLSLIWCGWSLATLAVLSAERYLAIEHALYYISNVNVQKSIIATVLSGIIMIVTLIVFRIQTENSYKLRQIPVAINVSICCCIILYCVGKVYGTANRQSRTIARQKDVILQRCELEKKKLLLKDMKRYSTLGMILLASVALYLPSLFAKAIGVTLGRDSTHDFKYISQFIWVTSIYIQSLVNPLIVSLRLSNIKKGVFKKFSFMRKIRLMVTSLRIRKLN